MDFQRSIEKLITRFDTGSLGSIYKDNPVLHLPTSDYGADDYLSIDYEGPLAFDYDAPDYAATGNLLPSYYYRPSY